MTASNLEPTLSSAGGECTREHVTDRVTSEVTHDELPPKRVTVADKTSDAAREPNDDNNNNSDQCLASATPTETTCCRASEPILAPTQAVPDQTVTRFNSNNNSAAAALKQPWHYGQPVQPNAISIYPPAHNFVHYPLASAVPQLAPPPPPFQPPQLSFYHAPPFVTWTCPISGNYQLPPGGGAHYYYAHQAQVQPLVAQHHQLCGAAIYQSATPPTDNNHHQYVTQTTPSDNDDDERQSHGSTPTPINAISTECAGNGSSAAGLDCAHTSKVTPAPLQATQQSDKSLASSSSSSSAPLDTAALDSVACGPIQRDDKCRDRAEQQQCELNKISYLNENDNEPASSQSQLEEGVSNAEEDDDDDERGSWRRSSSLCDDDGADTPLANYRAESMHDVEPQAAGTNNSTSCHLHQHRHQNSISSGTKSGVDGDGDRGGTCSPEAGPSGGASQSSAAEQHEDRPRANLMVEPVRGDSGSKFQQEKTAACEEDADEAKGPEGCGLALFKDANLDEPNESIINNQQLANQPTSESHQISINGTTFYHVDPTRLFLPPPPPPLNPQQQLPFLLSYYGPTNAYHTNQHQLPANNYFQRPVAQPSPYQQSAWCSPPPPTANSHSRLILHPPAPPAVDYPQSWLHHYAPYQHAHVASYPASQHQYQQSLLFAPSPPYLGGGPNLRPIIYHHHHSHDQAQAQVPPASQSMPAPPVPPTIVSTTSVSQLKLGYNLIPLLPIQAIPTRVRQAYGMDKVWQDEFEQMFAQFISQVVWTLVEVETNPNIRASSRILDYKNRYIVRVDGPAPLLPPPAATELAPMSSSTSCESSGDDTQEEEEGVKGKQVGQDDEEEEGDEDSSCHGSLNLNQSQLMMMMNERASNSESDCDSGAVLNSSSTSGSTSFETTCCQSDELSNTSSSGDSAAAPNDVRSFTPMTEADGKGAQSTGDANQLVASGARPKFPLKFRMFIDSAKVRFCCETCGHGWTSMKGRVVFWYELFELVDGFGPPPSRSSASYSKHASEQQQHGVSNLIGYCAYKLFGQQCDVCKVENRFERPMWYPEEVTKVLCNLYNKIGQLYFGFRMPTIDKQRRAGKPKTSHNSLLCQACHDGVCTDRK